MPALKPANTLTHLRYIDALRGLAFLGVLTIHSGLETPGFKRTHLTDIGRYGVELFFLLSAITLFRSMSTRTRKEEHPVRNYFIRRFFRIAPLFYLGMVIYPMFFMNGPTLWIPDGLHPWMFLTTLTFTHGWTPTSFSSVVPGGWSIAVEMTFYLCLPFLFRHLHGCWVALCAAFIALVAGGMLTRFADHFLYLSLPPEQYALKWEFLRFWFPEQLSVFLLGAALFYALQDPRVVAFFARSPTRPVAFVVASLYGMFAMARVHGTEWMPQHLLYSLLFSLLILGLAARPLRLFVNPLTCALGTISYSCYLTHFAALALIGAWLPPAWFAQVPHFGADARFVVTFLLTLSLTIVFSILTYWLIERPGIYLGKQLIKRSERRRLPALATT